MNSRPFARLLALGAMVCTMALGSFAYANPSGAGRPGGRGPVGAPGSGATNAELLAPVAGEVQVGETLGGEVDPNLQLVDHEGNTVRLGDYLDGERPVLLTMNYYRCPVLCNVQLNELTESLAKLDWTAGENFRVVTVSIDPREDTELAALKRKTHLDVLGRGDVDWSFHTADAATIRMLAAQVGVSYAYDKEQDQYAHPPVLVFLSPDGKVARYLYGLTYKPQDIRFALIEASDGRVGSPVEKLVLSCFHYDASLGQYGYYAVGIMRLSGAMMIVILGIPLFFAWRRERRRTLLGAQHNQQEARA